MSHFIHYIFIYIRLDCIVLYYIIIIVIIIISIIYIHTCIPIYPGEASFSTAADDANTVTARGALFFVDDGKIYRNPLYLMVKTMVSCRFSLKPIH